MLAICHGGPDRSDPAPPRPHHALALLHSVLQLAAAFRLLDMCAMFPLAPFRMLLPVPECSPRLILSAIWVLLTPHMSAQASPPQGSLACLSGL